MKHKILNIGLCLLLMSPIYINAQKSFTIHVRPDPNIYLYTVNIAFSTCNSKFIMPNPQGLTIITVTQFSSCSSQILFGKSQGYSNSSVVVSILPYAYGQETKSQRVRLAPYSITCSGSDAGKYYLVTCKQ